MKTEMKVLLYLKKAGQNKCGFCPVMGKITVQGQTKTIAQFSCKIEVNPNLWNSTAQRCIGKSKEAASINREIESLLLLIRSHFEEIEGRSQTVSANDVKNAFQGISTQQESLLKVFHEHNDEFAQRIGIDRMDGTLNNYRYTCRLVSLFIKYKYKVSDVPLKALDLLFIESFDTYLRVQEKQMISSVLGNIIRLKTIVIRAFNQGLLPSNPFAEFRPEIPKSKPRYLNSDEFSRIMNVKFSNAKLNFARDMFLFAAFTGLSYCDVCRLTESELKRDSDGNLWIETSRQKTGIPENVMLMESAIRLIEKYKGTGENGKMFSMITNSEINALLKKVAAQCGINRPLTYHQSRHTFASLICLQNGVPIESVSKALGHKNIQTTQQYAMVTHEKIDKDVNRLNERIADKYTLQGIEAPPSTILRGKRELKINKTI